MLGKGAWRKRRRRHLEEVKASRLAGAAMLGRAMWPLVAPNWARSGGYGGGGETPLWVLRKPGLVPFLTHQAHPESQSRGLTQTRAARG